jgi:hypothetical protein
MLLDQFARYEMNMRLSPLLTRIEARILYTKAYEVLLIPADPTILWSRITSSWGEMALVNKRGMP